MHRKQKIDAVVTPDDLKAVEMGTDWTDTIVANVEGARDSVGDGPMRYSTVLEAAASHLVNVLDQHEPQCGLSREASVRLFLAIWLSGEMR